MLKKDIILLKKIRTRLQQCAKDYEKISKNHKEEFLELHNEFYTLPHCLRWGLQATEEILGDWGWYAIITDRKVLKIINTHYDQAWIIANKLSSRYDYIDVYGYFISKDDLITWANKENISLPA